VTRHELLNQAEVAVKSTSDIVKEAARLFDDAWMTVAAQGPPPFDFEQVGYDLGRRSLQMFCEGPTNDALTCIKRCTSDFLIAELRIELTGYLMSAEDEWWSLANLVSRLSPHYPPFATVFAAPQFACLLVEPLPLMPPYLMLGISPFPSMYEAIKRLEQYWQEVLEDFPKRAEYSTTWFAQRHKREPWTIRKHLRSYGKRQADEKGKRGNEGFFKDGGRWRIQEYETARNFDRYLWDIERNTEQKN